MEPCSLWAKVNMAKYKKANRTLVENESVDSSLWWRDDCRVCVWEIKGDGFIEMWLKS